MSIAVIGPSSFVTCFELVGATGYEEVDEQKVASSLDKLVNQGGYKLIIIPERFAETTRIIREDVMK
ncbi:MAG: hypothetical protein GWN01_01610, partial [Nitrosopumilaceae archaeon]|nr:hypothetical protein [Nitrosopumilaceae archaeon]NIU82199.1 hypothetical protein [Candidatus Thorarchaeota archaeon]NIV64811.1 hypothetical protein [Nitrosopumilaceae archaeon]NIX60274.1 hypothetical protein [Nitrosopumilaceae archaeon]